MTHAQRALRQTSLRVAQVAVTLVALLAAILGITVEPATAAVSVPATAAFTLRATPEAERLAPLLRAFLNTPGVDVLVNWEPADTAISRANLATEFVGRLSTVLRMYDNVAYTAPEFGSEVPPEIASQLRVLAGSQDLRVLARTMAAVLDDPLGRAAMTSALERSTVALPTVPSACCDIGFIIGTAAATVGGVVVAVTGTIAAVGTCVALCVPAAIVGTVLFVGGSVYLGGRAIYEHVRSDTPAPSLPPGCHATAEITLFVWKSIIGHNVEGRPTGSTGCLAVTTDGSATTTNDWDGRPNFIRCQLHPAQQGPNGLGCQGDDPRGLAEGALWDLWLNVSAYNLGGVAGSVTLTCRVRASYPPEGCSI